MFADNTTTIVLRDSAILAEAGRIMLSGVQDHAVNAQIVGGEKIKEKKMSQKKRTWQIGRRIYEATHELVEEIKKDDDRVWPAGLHVYLEAAKKPTSLEKERHQKRTGEDLGDDWFVMLTTPMLDKKANWYLLMTTNRKIRRL